MIVRELIEVLQRFIKIGRLTGDEPVMSCTATGYKKKVRIHNDKKPLDFVYDTQEFFEGNKGGCALVSVKGVAQTNGKKRMVVS